MKPHPPSQRSVHGEHAIAIVGMACRYADASSPLELLQVALAQRRAFRRIPAERLRIEDYRARDGDPDSISVQEAALIEGYAFDRERFKVPGTAFRSADMAHWLALDVAARAIRDAGLDGEGGLPGETTGVIVGNTLTGDQSRAQSLRLRWPYFRRVLESAWREQGWSAADLEQLVARVEVTFKAPFEASNDESLAGGLSNTIAGRICNQFNLKGGGFVVDGACASSLLAVTSACSALVQGDLDVAIVGGVDLSIDPFELVGFSRLGALARDEMRVFDAHSHGFLPGEGCGFAVLVRHADAVARDLRTYALIRGWGVSSDGSGGITRPEAQGQRLALERAYRRAGFDAGSVAYFEAHGTGTPVGDEVELDVLGSTRSARASTTAVIGSIKANIGHTKAAAGMAGLIKAAMAIQQQVLPPTTGCGVPHPKLLESGNLRVLERAERWPATQPIRAGVSAMGFGGINTHVVLETASDGRRRASLTQQELKLDAAAQDAELISLAAESREELAREIRELLALVPRLSWAELSDLATELNRTRGHGRARAVAVAARPLELQEKLERIGSWLAEGQRRHLDVRQGVFLGEVDRAPRIGFLFPGQGSPQRSGGLWVRRFPALQERLAPAQGPGSDATLRASRIQPCLVASSLAGLELLDRLGIEAEVAIGHSLGELVALSWAGAYDESTALRLALARGRAMDEHGRSDGAMASLLGADATDLLAGSSVVIAAYNGPQHVVVSGPHDEVAQIVQRAQQRGAHAHSLRVSHAFHSPSVVEASARFASDLAREAFCPLERSVVSTVTGRTLDREADLQKLLVDHIAAPVRFAQALLEAEAQVDLWLEVGPGTALGALAARAAEAPVVSLDVGGESLGGLLRAVGAAFVLGAELDASVLFDTRFARPLDVKRPRTFFTNPCEGATPASLPLAPPSGSPTRGEHAHDSEPQSVGSSSLLDVVRGLVAQAADLPLSVVEPRHRLLADLHLTSITVAEVAVQAARRSGRMVPLSPASYASCTIQELAAALEQLPHAATPDASLIPRGVDTWIQSLQVEWTPRALEPLAQERAPAAPEASAAWQFFAAPDVEWSAALRHALGTIPGGGVALTLSHALDAQDLDALLAAGRAAHVGSPRRWVLVQQGGGLGASFARCLHLELGIDTCVVDLPVGHPDGPAWLALEVLACRGYTQARYDRAGARTVPVLARVDLPSDVSLPVGASDVVLVSGGGKGIGAECALGLARATGARLAILGRSQPESDAEVAANLERMRTAGIAVHYAVADVQDPAAVVAAVRSCEGALGGPITAFVHAAGINVPVPIRSLDRETLEATLGPKASGARNILAALDADRLRLFASFGSIIAEIGLPGEAHYALANERLAELTAQWQLEHPHCRSVCLEWSVWAGVGMGERLDRIDVLARQGIDAIAPERGVGVLLRLLAAPLPATSLVVTSRFGALPTVALDPVALPLWRFIERPRVHYPGIELVCETEVSSDTDLYLDDHRIDGQRVLPGVIGLEAMAQIAAALLESAAPPRLEHVEFLRPVIVPEGATVTLRLAALMAEPGCVDVILQSDATQFQVVHFRARCRASEPGSLEASAARPALAEAALDLDPRQHLYGPLLFHEGRFRRIGAYHELRARECAASLEPADGAPWFTSFYSDALLLGDPAARDAAIHAIQACVPHALVLPASIEAIVSCALGSARPARVHATERSRSADRFRYDVDILDAEGRLLERWSGLELRKLRDLPRSAPWPVALVGPYVERRAEAVAALRELHVALRVGSAPRGERHEISDRTVRDALGLSARVCRSPGGKPEVPGISFEVSVSHCDQITLAVAGPDAVACDVQAIVSRSPALWRDLLGLEGFALAELLASETSSPLDAAATRVWTGQECLKKLHLDVGLRLRAVHGDGWICFEAGSIACASATLQIAGSLSPLALAVAGEVSDARL